MVLFVDEYPGCISPGVTGIVRNRECSKIDARGIIGVDCSNSCRGCPVTKIPCVRHDAAFMVEAFTSVKQWLTRCIDAGDRHPITVVLWVIISPVNVGFIYVEAAVFQVEEPIGSPF